MLKRADLSELYGTPSERALNKQLKELDVHASEFICNSPFLVLATFDSEGNVDASPRGGKPGFVQIRSAKELALADAKGNNRTDSLKNISDTGRVGMLFLIPGMDETLRVNGAVRISNEVTDLEQFADENIPPKSCLIIDIEEVFLHCAKALMRSKLWDPASQIERSTMPTMGEMLKDQLGSDKEPESREDMIERYKKDL